MLLHGFDSKNNTHVWLHIAQAQDKMFHLNVLVIDSALGNIYEEIIIALGECL